MATLRSPHGCPWDRKQSHTSLRSYLLEETYEVLEALDRRDLSGLSGELGDLLFQVVFHAEIAAGERRFDAADVIEEVTAKLVRRHPHVFTPDGRPLAARAGRSGIRTPRAVVEQWEQIKAREQAAAGTPKRLLAGIPKALPALERAHKIGARAATVGFDWPHAVAVVDKIEEEVRELRQSLDEGQARTADEMGDLFFSLANLARQLQIDPEHALRQANDKFTQRFDALEAYFQAQGRAMRDVPLDELEAAWQSAKARVATRQASTSDRSLTAPPQRGRRSRR